MVNGNAVWLRCNTFVHEAQELRALYHLSCCELVSLREHSTHTACDIRELKHHRLVVIAVA
jgi:hypothetical protein